MTLGSASSVVGLAVLVVSSVLQAGCFGKGSAPSCSVSADCSGGTVCVVGECHMPGSAGPGSGCSATRDCADGLYCDAVMNLCAAGGSVPAGGACTTDADCTPPLGCAHDGFFGRCATGGSTELGGACTATADCLAGLYCGASMKCGTLLQSFPPFTGVACHDDGGFRAYFEVPRAGHAPADFFRLPFPNDARVTDGKLDMSDFPRPGPTPLGVDLVQLYVDAWTADFEGFSNIGAVTFRFSADVDFDTVTGDNVLFVDVTPGAMGHELGRDWSFNPNPTKYSCPHRFTVRNPASEPLLPKHTYAAVLTTGFRSKTGQTPQVNPDLAALLADAAPSDAALMGAWQSYKPLRDYLAGKGAQAPSVAAAAVFTVQDSVGHMQRLADNMGAQRSPALKDLTLCAAGVTSPCDDGTPDRACGAPSDAFHEIHGRFSVPIYQMGTPPYDTPADGGGIAEMNGMPTAVRSEDVCFALTVPKGAAMPSTGWPLVVYHHGTGGSMRSFIGDGLAEKMAMGASPAAVFGFDAVEHGARKGGSTKKPDDLVFNPLNPRAARDNFLQGAVDILQAFSVAGVTVAAGTSPTGAELSFDAGKVAFFGHSQGSTSGALALAYSNAAPAAVLSGAGAFLTQSLLHKTKPQNIGAGLSFLLGEPLDDTHPVMTIFQSFFDRSDPLSYNPLLVARPPALVDSKNVYMSWGTNDTYTPTATLEANAKSLRLAPVGPIVEDYHVDAITRPVSLNVTGGDGVKRTAAVFQYTSSGYDGHFVAQRNTAAVADWSAFLGAFLSGAAPSVP